MIYGPYEANNWVVLALSRGHRVWFFPKTKKKLKPWPRDKARDLYTIGRYCGGNSIKTNHTLCLKCGLRKVFYISISYTRCKGLFEGNVYLLYQIIVYQATRILPQTYYANNKTVLFMILVLRRFETLYYFIHWDILIIDTIQLFEEPKEEYPSSQILQFFKLCCTPEIKHWSCECSLCWRCFVAQGNPSLSEIPWTGKEV